MERTGMERPVPEKQNATPSRSAFITGVMKTRDILFICLHQWPWFCVSFLVAAVASWCYLNMTPKSNSVVASIMIKSDEQKSSIEAQLKELGVNPTSVNVQNELLSLTTYAMATELNKRLRLDVTYKRKGILLSTLLYGAELPLELRFEGLNDEDFLSLRAQLQEDGSVELSDMEFNGSRVDGHYTLRPGLTAQTPLGRVTEVLSPYWRKGMTEDMIVERQGRKKTLQWLQHNLHAVLRDKNTTVIDISFADESVARAENILSTVVAIYNENWVKDRNQMSLSTDDFIRERLGVIEHELGSVDENISSYKSRHLVPDVEQVSSMAVSQANTAEQQDRDLEAQLYMVRYIRSRLSDPRHAKEQLPAGTGLNNTSMAAQIDEYNNTLMQRNNHLAVSSLQNPLVIDLDKKLSTLRGIILASLDNETTMLHTRKRMNSQSHRQATSKIVASPEQAKYILSVERQQKVKESLYLFLLQKREENELTQAFTAYNTRLIEPPHSDGDATPVDRNIYLLALLLALVVPATCVVLRESLNTKVRGRRDLDNMRTPFVGEIPLAPGEEKKKKDKTRHHHEEQPTVLVMERNRDMVNEAFRVVRTNLESMLGFDTTHRVMMTTSMNPGSGKTFFTANIATAMGIKGKKTLAIDLDLRRGSLSAYVGKPHRGISDYINGKEDDYRPLIVPLGNVDVLPCGAFPPNPTELLFTPRFKNLIETVRQAYDFVFIDCPPVEIVADAAIISRHVDLSLFMVRAGLLDSGFLPDIDNWYTAKKYNKMAIVLNGTSDAFSHYGYHKYGYRYGYHYGHYGYGEDRKDKK